MISSPRAAGTLNNRIGPSGEQPWRKHRTVETIDDLTGTPGARTHRLRWDNRDVETDLTDKNAADLYEVLQPYLAAGRPVSPAAVSRPQPAHEDGDRRDRQAVRAWARTHGHPVSDRGQIPRRVRQAYDAAH